VLFLANRTVIFYFSGTGNTWWVGKKLEEHLKNQGQKTKRFAIEAKKLSSDRVEKLVQKADIIGIGYPIYGSDVPAIALQFIKELPKIEEEKKAFVFTTMMEFSGDGAIVAKRLLQKKGFSVRQAVNIKMPNNVRLPHIIVRRFPIRNDDELTKIKEKADKKALKLAEKIATDKRWIEGADPFNIAGALMQRVPVRLIGWTRWAKNFFVDEESCIECMQCVDYCPTDNITFANGHFSWGEECIVCLRCYNLCPKDAIQYKKATLNREKYPRYKGPGNDFKVSKLRK
jgi:ferredoxin